MAVASVFAKRINKRANQTEDNINTVIKAAAGAIVTGVVLPTPVDTGRARGGWVVGLGTANRGAGPLDPSGTSTVASGKAKLASRRPGQTIYISNNVNYIGDLNNGSSRQAPANFVSQGVLAGILTLRTQGNK